MYIVREFRLFSMVAGAFACFYGASEENQGSGGHGEGLNLICAPLSRLPLRHRHGQREPSCKLFPGTVSYIQVTLECTEKNKTKLSSLLQACGCLYTLLLSTFFSFCFFSRCQTCLVSRSEMLALLSIELTSSVSESNSTREFEIPRNLMIDDVIDE